MTQPLPGGAQGFTGDDGSWEPTDPYAAQPRSAPAEDAENGGIATLPPPDDSTPERSPNNPRTGEPRRPWTIWASTLLAYCATTITAVAIAFVMWNSIADFAHASWINGLMRTDKGSWVRVAFSIINAVLAAFVAGAPAFVGYYAFVGSRWTRWGGIAATLISLFSLALTPLAALSIIPTAISAGLLWLRPSRRYVNAWTAQREWKVTQLDLPDRIRYGPVPRYSLD